MIWVKYYLNYIFFYIAVGKSSISFQFTDDKFKEQHEKTTELKFSVKRIELNGKTVKIKILDTAGHKEKVKEYYKKAIGALLVYDITIKETFKNVKKWLTEVKFNCSKQIKIILIGNKKDLEDKREVTYEEGKALAKENGFMFFEISAKNSDDVVEVFKKSFEFILNNIIDPSEISDFEIKLADYGYAKSIKNNNSKFFSFVGTDYYNAPEIYKNQGCSKSDLWSIGLILYYLYHNNIPFNNMDEYINSNKDIELKPTSIKIFDDLLNRLLVKDYNKRINWDDYFNHPFNNLQRIEIYINIESDKKKQK